MDAFFSSQFGYYSSVWMLHSWTLNNIVNKTQEKTLCLVYNDSIKLSTITPQKHAQTI